MNKKLILTGLIMAILLMTNCQKEEQPSDAVFEKEGLSTNLKLSEFQQNLAIDQLAHVLAIGMNEVSVRELLHNEIGKQITCDYDIPYSLIKDKLISSGQFGEIAFSRYLEEIARLQKIEIKAFMQFEPQFKNLQISSPVFFEKWNYELYNPVVISLPVDYVMNMPVFGYQNNGERKILFEEGISQPFILVRKSERVDENGYLRISSTGFVIPEDKRFTTAEEAYNQTGSSGYESNSKLESLISVVNDIQLKSILDQVSSLQTSSLKSGYDLKTVTEMFSKLSTNSLKSGQLALQTPAVTGVFPDEPYSVRINWAGVPGATKYEIWRQYSYFNPEKVATLSDDWFSYMDCNLNSGQSYYYSIRAVDDFDNKSPLSAPYEAIASWRQKGARDIVSQIYITDACWNWCCGLFDGKIELQYKAAYYDLSIKSVSGYPGGSTNLNNLGQKTKNQQKGKYCFYDEELFPWTIEEQSYDYRLNLVEDDGDGTGLTVELGGSFKIPIKKIEQSVSVKISFKIANGDETLGDVLVSYWDYRGKSYYFSPRKGSAVMTIRQ